MSSLRSIWAICAQNFRKWRTDYRVWTIAALTLIMIAIYMDNMRTIANALGTDMPIWTFPFLYSQFHTKIIFTLPVILLFCGAPFIDENQTFVIMRSGRAKWMCGQMMYIIITSALYYVFLFTATLLFTIFTGEKTLSWGKTILTVANSAIAFEVGSNFIEIVKIVPTFFSPLLAVWFTFLLSWFSAVLIGAVLFTCNYLTGTRIIGMAVCTVLTVFPAVVEGMPQFVWFSPISWNTLDKIDVGGLTKHPPFGYCVSVYCVLIILLFAASFIFGKNKNLDKG